MRKQQDEPIKGFLENLKRPTRTKSEQSNQQKTSPQDRDRRAALDALNEKRRQWLEKLKAKEGTEDQGES